MYTRYVIRIGKILVAKLLKDFVVKPLDNSEWDFWETKYVNPQSHVRSHGRITRK